MKVVKNVKRVTGNVMFFAVIAILSYIGLSAIKYGQTWIGIISSFAAVLSIVAKAVVVNEIKKYGKESELKEKRELSTFEKGCNLFLSCSLVAFIVLILFSYTDINYKSTKENFVKACDYSISQDSDKNMINDINFYKAIQFLIPRDAKIVMTYTINEFANVNKLTAMLETYQKSISNKISAEPLKTELTKTAESIKAIPVPEKAEKMFVSEMYCFRIIILLQIICGVAIIISNIKVNTEKSKTEKRTG